MLSAPRYACCVLGRLRIIGPDGAEHVPVRFVPRTLLALW